LFTYKNNDGEREDHPTDPSDGNLGYVRDGDLFGGIEGCKSQWGVKTGYTPKSDCHIVTRLTI